MNENAYLFLEKLLIKNNIRVNQEELKLQFLSHPDYPSLQAFTGVLQHFGINNLAIRIPVNKENMEELPPCFIGTVSKKEKEVLVLVEKKKGHIKIAYHQEDTKKVSEAEFLKTWNGLVLAVEKDENFNRETNLPFANRIKWIFYLLLFLSTGYFVYLNADLFSGAHFILSILGLALSVFIIQHELGMQSSITNNFCNLTDSSSCDAVLNSSGAALFGNFKLSDLSIIAFATYNLYWLITFNSGVTNYYTIVILTLLAIPFIVYSFFYQYSVVKKWCPLCLGIAAVLLLQVGILFLGDFSMALLTIDLSGLLSLLASLTATFGIWNYLKPLLEKKEYLKKLEVKHYQFKRNFSVFNNFYNESKTIRTPIGIPGEIVLGNPKAPLEIILITSPLCYFCKQAHLDIEQLLLQAQGRIKVIIRFNIDASDKEGLAYSIVSQLLELYRIKDRKSFHQTLEEVYNKDADLTKWLRNQKIEPGRNNEEIISHQQNWCKENNINFTPAFYINGKQLPEAYEISDFIYFIDDLTELQKNSTSQLIDGVLKTT